jgi:hypothetical protein
MREIVIDLVLPLGTLFAVVLLLYALSPEARFLIDFFIEQWMS